MYNSLVIGAGAMKGIVALGALYHYELHHMLTTIHTFVGTSVGGMICLMLATGYKPSEIINKIVDNQIEISKMITVGPGYTISVVKQLILTRSSVDIETINFVDFSKIFKKKLHLVATCINSGHTFVMNEQESPEMTIAQALQATTAIPLLFAPVTFQKHCLVDGAISCSFPINQITWTNDSKLLGIDFHSDAPESQNCVPNSNILLSLIHTVMAHFSVSHVVPSAASSTFTYLKLKCKINALQFNLDKHQKLNAIKDGYFQAMHHENPKHHFRRRTI